MCGIVGIVGPHDSEWIENINEIQIHRGPDDQGVYYDPESQVTLAMRRLSIVDLADGHQPMIDEHRQRVVVFNGEIFNAPNLRKNLLAEGYRFHTRNSDTEVLLYLYDIYGEGMVKHLNGMFAFVIYDKIGRCLFGARDRVGIKPLHWFHDHGRSAFASEIKSLLKLPFVCRELNLQGTHHYFTLQFIPPPLSIFKNIFKLPSGHRFMYRVEDNHLKVER